jgi:Transposase
LQPKHHAGHNHPALPTPHSFPQCHGKNSGEVIGIKRFQEDTLLPVRKAKFLVCVLQACHFKKFLKILAFPSLPLKTLAKKNKEPNSTEKSHMGRPRKTTREQDEQILQAALADRGQKYKDIQERVAPGVSITTIRRRLREKHLQKWLSMERMCLDDEITQERLDWAIEHRDWTREM